MTLFLDINIKFHIYILNKNNGKKQKKINNNK